VSREYLLLPANRAFIAFTLVAAFLLNLPPWGRIDWVPDFLALVLVFWNIHQPTSRARSASESPSCSGC